MKSKLPPSFTTTITKIKYGKIKIISIKIKNNIKTMCNENNNSRL